MTAREFDRFLRFRLCWTDGTPTSSSHAGQRQCSQCRRKWSYEVLSRRWVLAGEFCKGSSRRTAAKAAGMDVHTAGRHYERFHDLVAAHFGASVRRKDGSFYMDPERLARYCRDALKVPDPRKRLLLLGDLCLQEMDAEARIDLIYRLAFRERLQKLTNSALRARFRQKSTD